MYNWFAIECEAEYQQFERDRSIAANAKAMLAQTERARPRWPRVASFPVSSLRLRSLAGPWFGLAKSVATPHGAACKCAPGD
jgi:hypothetical protein